MGASKTGTEQSGKVLLGSMAGGEHVSVQVTLDTFSPASTCTSMEHRIIPAPPQLSIVWFVGRDYSGQIPPEERLVVRTHNVPQLQQVEEWWEGWHLNTMHAECAHMTPEMLTPPEGHAPDMRHVNEWRLANVACPVSGYRYRTDWLATPLPDDVLTAVRAFIKENS